MKEMYAKSQQKMLAKAKIYDKMQKGLFLGVVGGGFYQGDFCTLNKSQLSALL